MTTTDLGGPAAVTVVGEALVDLVPLGGGQFVAHPGGSPFNVAVGLSRLGVDTALMARLADNSFGRMLRDHAAAEGIDLSAAPRALEPTTLAVVSLDADARATYDFYASGTADWQWSEAELGALPARTAILHFGSLASWTPPGDEMIASMIATHRRSGDVIVSYDPNVRPLLLRDRAKARPLVERAVALTHIAKASTEDIEWLYPDLVTEQVAELWLRMGAELVVVTDGPGGAKAFNRAGGVIARPGLPAEVVDTVGAGDSFTSGLLASFVGRGVRTPAALAGTNQSDLAAAVDDAILASALTCQRAGADPPTAAEVSAARARRR